MTGNPIPDSESWTTTTSYGRADLTQHPLIREAYKVACLIERCGASPELTTASCTAFALCELLSDYFRGLDAGRVNAPSGTMSEPVATEPQGSAGESPAPIHRPSNPNLCEECGKPATQWMRRDPFGKSDAMRAACGEHGVRLRDPADVAEIDRLTRERDELRQQVETLQNRWATRPLSHPDGEALAAENVRLRAALEWLRAWRKRDPESVDDLIELVLRGTSSPVETKPKRAYYETHDPPHCPTCGCGLPREDACSCGRVELKDGYVRATCADGSVHTKGGCTSPSKAGEEPAQRRAYYETHDPPHCPTCGCGIPPQFKLGEGHDCQHDRFKPGFTLEWLGSTPQLHANTHRFMCKFCREIFDLAIGEAQLSQNGNG